MTRLARIIIPLPLHVMYDYLIPEHHDVQVGQVVGVFVGKQSLLGIVHGLHTPDTPPAFKLRPLRVLNETVIVPETYLDFIQKMAGYNVIPVGDIVKTFLNFCMERQNLRGMVCYRRTDKPLLTKLSNKRKEILDLLHNTPLVQGSELPEHFSPSALKGLCDLGILEKIYQQETPPLIQMNPNLPPCPLGTQQQQAFEDFLTHTTPPAFKPFFIDGVTGSGKTELCFEMVASVLRQNPTGQILILVPEIALTHQVAGRFEKRFGIKPALWHSDLSHAQKRLYQAGILQGTIQCVIGARSALLLPFYDLSVIIVDEEHDSSYKQEEGMRYNARDMAVLRAKSENIPIILASATPSLETYVNTELGRYHKLVLTERFGGATLPDIELIDMKQSPPDKGRWISGVLTQAILETASKNEQALLFINRRGYAPLMICQGCGYRIECSHCKSAMVYHKQSNQLRCHQCGYHCLPPTTCPSCGTTDKFSLCGPGVERLHEEVREHFPTLRCEILSSDHFTNFERLKELLARIHAGDIDILIGTQMVAKGHDFGNLTLVGVIDADIGLLGGDLRASEKCFQLMEQVSGRAGRQKNKQGRVLLQTYHPDHPVMQALKQRQRDAFLDYEAQMRLDLQHPPFARMASLIVVGTDAIATKNYALQMAQSYEAAPEVQIFGPTPAVLFMLRDKYRYRFLLKAPKNYALAGFLHIWLAKMPKQKDIQVHVDIDPISFM